MDEWTKWGLMFGPVIAVLVLHAVSLVRLRRRLDEIGRPEPVLADIAARFFGRDIGGNWRLILWLARVRYEDIQDEGAWRWVWWARLSLVAIFVFAIALIWYNVTHGIRHRLFGII